MKKYKRASLAILIAGQLLLSAMPSFAADSTAADSTAAGPPAEELVVLLFDEVDERVRTGNMQIKSNSYAMLNITNNDGLEDMQYSLMSAAFSISNMSSQMMGLAMASMDPSVQALAAGTSASLGAISGQLDAQAKQMNISQRQKELFELKLAEVDEMLVRGTQSLLPIVEILKLNLKKTEAARPLLEEVAEVTEARLRLGMAARYELDEAEAALVTLDFNRGKLEKEITSLGYELNKLLGRDFDAPLEVAPLPEFDREYFDAIVLEDDLKVALESNYVIKYKKLEKLDITGSSRYESYNREREMKQLEIDMYEQVIKAALTKQYAEIRAKLDEIDEVSRQKALLEQKLWVAEKKLELGSGIALSVSKAENDIVMKELDLELLKAELFWAAENYKWIIRGIIPDNTTQ